MDSKQHHQLKIGLLTGTTVIPREESPSDYISYSFVDVLELAGDGATLETGLELQEGETLDFMYFDSAEKNWQMHYSKVVRCKPSQAGSHLCVVEFLERQQGTAESDLRFLMNTELFQYLPQNVFLQLVNVLSRETIPQNDILLSQGSKNDRLFIIQHGSIDQIVQDSEDNHRIGRLTPGDVLGEVSLLTGEPSLYTAVTYRDCVVWSLEKNLFTDLLVKLPDLRLFMTELVTKHFERSTYLAERIIGKFFVKERLGKGGYGLVYRGEHSILGFQAAVKMLKHDMALEDSFVESFRNEAKMIAGLSHQNIVQVYDIEETYQTIFIVMELLKGESLQDLLYRQKQLPYERTVSILKQVLAALDYAHQYKVVHRDIKPDNIFLLPGDQVKVLDFGLACAFDTEDHSMAGTIYYSPPEQIDGDPVGPPSDIYSTGIMAYEMLVGNRPYPEDDLMDLMDLHCNEDIPDPRGVLPDIPERLNQFIIKACRRDPTERYACAADALEALGGIRDEHESRQVTVLSMSCKESKTSVLNRLVEEFSDKASQAGVSIKMMTIDDH